MCGRSLLELQLDRMCRAVTVGTIVVAIPEGPQDDGLHRHVGSTGHRVHRGHPTDLLDRHVQVARRYDAEVVVKIPSDCPLVDPEVIDTVIGRHLEDPSRHDYISNLHPMTWPDGQDVEVMTRATLETAWSESSAPFEREHTTPFIWERPHRFRVGNVAWDRDLSRRHRLTVDYEEDLRLVEEVVNAVGPHAPVADIVEHLERSPDVDGLNASYRGVNWYRHHLDELRTVGPDDTAPAPAESRETGHITTDPVDRETP